MKTLPQCQTTPPTLATALCSQAPTLRCPIYSHGLFGGILASPSPPWTSEVFLCAPSLLTPKLPNAEVPQNCQRDVSEEEAAFPGETHRLGPKRKTGPQWEGMW